MGCPACPGDSAANTGLDYYQVCYYNSMVGRFSSPCQGTDVFYLVRDSAIFLEEKMLDGYSLARRHI